MSVGTSATAVGFWLAPVLPFVYLPVVLAGIDSPSKLFVFVCLLGLNVVALVVGHDYPGPRP